MVNEWWGGAPRIRAVVWGCLWLTLAGGPLPAVAGEPPPVAAPAPLTVPAPGPRTLCPVCGMFVAKYPEWRTTVVWRDGTAHHFDGAKDLFRFLWDLPRYAPERRPDGIALIAVTEYYGLTPLEAHRAWYVMGSNVHGPMGHELIPLASEEEAREFMADHGGNRLLRFDEVTPGVLELLQGKGADR